MYIPKVDNLNVSVYKMVSLPSNHDGAYHKVLEVTVSASVNLALNCLHMLRSDYGRLLWCIRQPLGL